MSHLCRGKCICWVRWLHLIIWNPQQMYALLSAKYRVDEIFYDYIVQHIFLVSTLLLMPRGMGKFCYKWRFRLWQIRNRFASPLVQWKHFQKPELFFLICSSLELFIGLVWVPRVFTGIFLLVLMAKWLSAVRQNVESYFNLSFYKMSLESISSGKIKNFWEVLMSPRVTNLHWVTFTPAVIHLAKKITSLFSGLFPINGLT